MFTARDGASSLNESPELIAQECLAGAGNGRHRIRLNESPELIAQESGCGLARIISRGRIASMKVLSLLLRNRSIRSVTWTRSEPQ